MGMGRRKGPSSQVGGFCLALIFLLGVSTICGTAASAFHLSCIANCSQCVKIYAEFFDGRQCAEYCIRMQNWSEGVIDCNDPTTISRFIRYT